MSVSPDDRNFSKTKDTFRVKGANREGLEPEHVSLITEGQNVPTKHIKMTIYFPINTSICLFFALLVRGVSVTFV